METVKPEKGLENLRRELDLGHAVLIWGDLFSASWSGLPQGEMWAMVPMLVVGQEEDGFWVVAGSQSAFKVSVEEMQSIRGRVKKDRYRMMVLEGVDEGRWLEGLRQGIESCCALYLDKPPAGSPKNFGLSGMNHFVAMVGDEKTALGWGKKFPAGDQFKQALAGKIGQPGIWDWIEAWGTDSGADRSTYARFLQEAGPILGKDFGEAVEHFEQVALTWQGLAEATLPDSVTGLKRLKEIKLERSALRWIDPLGSIDRRLELADEYGRVWNECGDLADEGLGIRDAIVEAMSQIIEIEGKAVQQLRDVMARN